MSMSILCRIDKNEHVYSVQNINDTNKILRVNISHMKKIILRWEMDLHSDGSYSETFFEADASEDESKSEKEPEDDPRWECEVEKVVDKRTRNGEVQYRVKWKGYTNQHKTRGGLCPISHATS